MNKETMIKELSASINEAVKTSQEVVNFLDVIEDTVVEDKEAVASLEAHLQTKMDTLLTFTDLEKAKVAQAEITNLETELSLLKNINEAKVKAQKVELEDKAEAFFVIHKTTKFKLVAVDSYLVANTSLSELTETLQMVKGLSHELHSTFSTVRNILLDTGIVANENQNKQYRGIHLGQALYYTKLIEFEYEVKDYMQVLKATGIEVK